MVADVSSDGGPSNTTRPLRHADDPVGILPRRIDGVQVAQDGDAILGVDLS